MTSRNTRTPKYGPFLLSPAGKAYLWGGNRLRDDFAKDMDLTPLAETWECSTHPDGFSRVASGPFEGQVLSDVIREHPEFMGTHPKSKRELPILVKLIDARQDLSVQVHPDDDYAEEHEGGQSGKTEMWYVVDAAPGASLIYGFYEDITKERLRRAIQNGTVERYLQRVPIRKNDVFFIRAGQVHAIGKGALIAEVQQSSNLTYRMYDYGRLDKDGRQRKLHVEKALDVANLKGSGTPRQPMRVLRFQNGAAYDLLCRCEYFQTERMLLNTETCREMAAIQAGTNSFEVLLCTEGCGVCFWGEGESLNFCKGDCVFLPAGSAKVRMHGKAQLLRITC